MRRSRSSAVPLLAALAAAAPLAAQTVEGGAFLLLPVGARAAALGQAAIADGGSTEALYWNPAGLASLRRGEAAVHHYAAFFGDGDALTLAVPIPAIGVIGFGAYIVNYGDLEVTPPGGGGTIPIGRLSPRNVALTAAFATDLGPVSAGFAYKLVQFRADCSGDCTNVPSTVGTTHAVDIGVQAALFASPLIVGVAVRNLGFPLQVNNQAQADPLPTRVVVGVKWPVVRPPGQVDALDLTILADLETPVQGEIEAAPMLGLESGVRDVVRLRVGYAFVDAAARGPSLGLGVHVGRVGVDLARTFYATDAVGEKEPMHISVRLAL